MSATIGLAVTMIEVEKRRLREKIAMATKAFQEIEEISGECDELEGEDLKHAIVRLRWVATSAATLVDERTPCRPGAGKRVMLTFVRRAKGFALALEPHPQDFDSIDRMQVETAFAAISDWLSIAQARQGQTIREAQDAALVALRTRAEAALPGYRVIIEDQG